MKFLRFLGALCFFAFFALPTMGQEWVQKQVIPMPQQSAGGISNYNTKYKMAFSDGYLFVTNPFLYSINNYNYVSGKLYIYKQVNGVWQLDAEIGGFERGFGVSIAAKNGICVVGQPNSFHVFSKYNDTWVHTQSFNTSTSDLISGIYQGAVNWWGDSYEPYIYGDNLHFARNVVLKDNFLFVNSTNEELYGNLYGGRGAVYMYKKEQGVYKFIKKIKHGQDAGFGTTVQTIDNDLFVLGNNKWYIYNINQIASAQGYVYNAMPNQMQESEKQEYHYDKIRIRANQTFINYELKTHVKEYNSWREKSTIKNYNFYEDMYDYGTGFLYTDNILFASPAKKSINIPNYGTYTIPDSTAIQVYNRVGNGWLPKSKISIPNPSKNLKFLFPFEIQDESNIFVAVQKRVGTIDSFYVYHFQKGIGNIIKGNVYHDKNQNCQKDANEVGETYYTILVEPNGHMTSTDENGNYELEVGQGTYTISQAIPQNKGLSVTQTCPANQGTHTVAFNNFGNIASGYNFANQVQECTFLTVDVTSRRRRCFRNQTVVKYENEGFVTANNAYIKVAFPEYVIPLSSTTPWVSQSGNTYTFNVGNLQSGQKGQFTVTDSVACVPNIMGLIQCTEAKIYPKNSCSSPTWNGASLEITSKCLNTTPHKARFVFRNNGTANMTTHRSYKVWANNTLILQNLVQLTQGDSLVLEIPTNGANMFLQAEQVAGHPDGTMVSAMVLNCGNDLPTSAGSPNLQMMMMPNDEYANSELDCMPIVDSYDPNDKAVSPAGITENNTNIDFKLHRKLSQCSIESSFKQLQSCFHSVGVATPTLWKHIYYAI
jgi:hypothetical protein